MSRVVFHLPSQAYRSKQWMYRDVVSALLIEDNFKVVSDKAAVRVKNDKKVAGFRVLLKIFGKYLGVQRYGLLGGFSKP